MKRAKTPAKAPAKATARPAKAKKNSQAMAARKTAAKGTTKPQAAKKAKPAPARPAKVLPPVKVAKAAGKKPVAPAKATAPARPSKAPAATKAAVETASKNLKAGKNAVAPAAAPALAKGKGKNSAAAAAAAVVQKVNARLSGRTAPEPANESVCREVACEGLGTTAGYCRLHYIKNWRKIKRKEVILREGKLNIYIEELVAKYPEKYLEAIRQDLTSDKEFAKVIHDLDLDENMDEFEGEATENEAVIDTIKREFEDDSDGF